MDQTLTAHIMFFIDFFKRMGKDDKIGILTGRSDTQGDYVRESLHKIGIDINFYVGKPDKLQDVPNGLWKAEVCNKLGVDVLFDDFQNGDPKMLTDFFSHNDRTLVFITPPELKV